MKLGIGSHTFGWRVGIPGRIPTEPMNAAQLLEWAKLQDVKVVQIADNMPLHKMRKSEIENILEISKKNEISIEIGMRGLLPELLTKYIEIADFFNSKIIRVVIDTETYFPPIQQIISILKSLENELKNNKIILGIENHDRFKADELVGIMESIDTEVIGICLDTANSLGAGEGIDEIIEKLGPWTVNLHIKDFIIQRVDYKMGFVVVGSPVGEGQLNIPSIINRLNKYKRNNISAIIELWTPPEKSLEETIKKEENWAVNSINYLKNILIE